MDDGSESSTTQHTAAQLVDALRASQRLAYSNDSDDELNRDEIERLSNALFERFCETPGAAAFDDPLEGPNMLAELAAAHFGVTIATLSSRQLDELLFETIPAKVSVNAERAEPIIQSTRALFAWLGREAALEQVAELIDLLGDDAVRELEERMRDESRYGPAKTLVMEAMAAGVDLTSKEAINEFMASRMEERLNQEPDGPFGGLYDDFPPLPSSSTPPLTPEQQRTRQKKRKRDRKAARKARKKNR